MALSPLRVAASSADDSRRERGETDALSPVLALIKDDMAEVNGLIGSQLTAEAALIEEIGRYLIESGGKRLRPMLVLLAARCCAYDGSRHIALATIIEYLHTATLLHDDVVDRSRLRRGRLTANSLWGNAPSVLVGDFLYSRAFQLMVELDHRRVLAILAKATNLIAQGEVMQLSDIGCLDITEERYMEVIRRKTALLFQAAAESGAALAAGGSEQVAALRNFGLEFGLAYQLVDDWLDYAGDAQSMGKNAGDDLAEGKLTLPLIFTLATAPDDAVEVVRNSLIARSTARLRDVFGIVKACGALDYTRAAALRHSQKAMRCLDALPDNEYRKALRAFTEFAQARLA